MKKKKVLIIEDDRATSEMLGFLASQLNLNVIGSSNVLPVKDIHSFSPDLIILDHWLGNELGGDLCLKLKADPLTKDIPVVLISAIPSLRQVATDSCADGYLAKPFDIDDLIGTIIKFLKK